MELLARATGGYVKMIRGRFSSLGRAVPSVDAVLRKLLRPRRGRTGHDRGRQELAQVYGVRSRLEALVKACEIEERWRRRGLSLRDMLFYGEWSGLAAAEGLPFEDLFFDSRDWMNLMWLAGLPDDGSVSACEALEKLRPTRAGSRGAAEAGGEAR